MASDGSYFQCPHFRKRYAASAKARAADGKRIRCKQCQELFTLTIVAASKPRRPSPTPVQQPRPAVKTKKEPQAKRKPATKKTKRSYVQWGTVVLLCLVLAGSGSWWWLNRVDQTDAITVPQKAIEEKNSASEVVDESPLISADKVKALTQEIQAPDPSTLNFAVSTACRDVAAAQWLNDYTLTHTRFRQAEYVRLLDESVGLTARLHKKCQNSQLLLSVIESAKMGKKPHWLAPLINKLIAPDYDSSKLVGDEDF